MRPGDFSPGNQKQERFGERQVEASMRPGDFSPGNRLARQPLGVPAIRASMRPGDFSPGNAPQINSAMAALRLQ